MKAGEDAEDASYNAFMGNVSSCRRGCKGSQTSFNLSVTTFDLSGSFDSNSKRLDSLEESDFEDEENEEEDEEDEEEEVDLVPLLSPRRL